MATEEEFQHGDVTVADSPIADPEAFVCEVVSLISETRGVEPLELPPLADAIDPEAVHRVLYSGATGPSKVSFHYAGCEVVVTSDGELFALDRSADPE